MDKFILISIVLTVFETANAACPSHWKSFAGSCYLIHTNSRDSWRDAAHYCERHSSHLVHLDYEEENQFVIKQLQPHIDEDKDSGRRAGVWTGGTDSHHEGTWVWETDDHRILEYTNWNKGQPDSGDGHHDEDCMCMIGNHGYQWEDYRCSDEMFYVCEMVDDSYILPITG